MSKLAIPELMLPGATVQQRLVNARDLGFAAVEFATQDLDARIDEVYDALKDSGLKACGVNMGGRDGWLAADRATRDDAADALCRALTCALDLEADYVSFVPQYGTGDLPDLTPFASPMDLQKELLLWLLRGACDLADTMDAALAIQPVNHCETSFLTRLEHAAMIKREADDHSMITIAANTYHLALEEEDLLSALAEHIEAISVIYLADSNGRRPGRGHLPFPAIGEVLASATYRGWLVLDSSRTRSPAPELADLRACLDYLRGCGID